MNVGASWPGERNWPRSHGDTEKDSARGPLHHGPRDHPALHRQAPHTWNVRAVADAYPQRHRPTIVGRAYAYQYQNLNSGGTPIASSDLTAGGTTGPGGDIYLYAHLQLDAQATIRIGAGISLLVYGLNLTNEVFGFYNGSSQYRKSSVVRRHGSRGYGIVSSVF
jgi:hypothetical protein